MQDKKRKNKYKIVIVGAGTWGAAIANMLAQSDNDVTVYARSTIQVEIMNKKRIHKKLDGFKFENNIVFTDNLKEAVLDKDIIIIAVPSIAFRDVVKDVVRYCSGKEYFVTLTKGMEDRTLFTMSEIIEDELKKHKIKTNKIVALSGPTHAEEVAKNLPTTAVSSAKSLAVAKFIQDVFMNNNFRVYTNKDIKGVEVCAAFKNVIGLAAGLVSGLGYGDNIKAAVITRGLAEMTRAGSALHCKKETFYGLAGLGDMVVTATSTHSRNYRCGVLLGQGYDVKKAIEKIGMVVEGVNFIPKAMKIISKYKIDLPITSAMNEIIFRNKDPKQMVNILMNRSKKSE